MTNISSCTKADFDQILIEFGEFWDNEKTLPLHHPTLIYEFGNSAFVIKQEHQVVAYLFGFLSQTAPIGYVHLIGVRRMQRRQGLGKRLYEYFAAFARERGCTSLKAITSILNRNSIAFHKSIGMEPIGELTEGEVPIVKDYSGPGLNRVVFEKKL
jgi:GNAT superfamily N-acetyltransferase